MDFFNVRSVFFQVAGYPLSYIEFWATLTGVVAVIMLARNQAWGWPVGLINVVLLGILFFQVQLYADVFLQGFFFLTNLVGWWRWTHPLPEEATAQHVLRVSVLSAKDRAAVVFLCALSAWLLAYLVVRLPRWLPDLFPKPSAFPYLDSLVTATSVWATVLAIRKKIESWILWMAVDALALPIYLVQGIGWVSIQYVIFLFIAVFAFFNWRKIYRSYSP